MASATARRSSVSVVIPSRNGRELLRLCLPPLLRGLAVHDEVIVVDDASDDGTADFLSQQFPTVALVRLPVSRGFGDVCNVGVERAKSPLVLLLNNDMVVEEGFLEPLTGHFSEADVFAVGAQYRMRRGLPRAYVCGICGGLHREAEQVPHTLTLALDAPAGGGLFDRAKFLQLGGFDPLFRPFYWEDMDLGYRAWQRGWRILREPRSVMYHEEGATIRSLHSRQWAELIHERNRLLFVWKNVHDWDLLVQHCCLLGLRAAQDLFVRTGMLSLRALLAAVGRLPPTLRSRLRACHPRGFGDRELAHRVLPWTHLFLNQIR
jgi:GT2 family glycosyltransferase